MQFDVQSELKDTYTHTPSTATMSAGMSVMSVTDRDSLTQRCKSKIAKREMFQVSSTFIYLIATAGIQFLKIVFSALELYICESYSGDICKTSD